MVALRDPQLERACQHLAAGFALTPEERDKRGLSVDASLKEEAAAIGGLDPEASSFKANARKFCQRKAVRGRVAEIQYAGAALASTSVGSLIVEAEAARAGAMQKKDFSAAIAGVQTKAKARRHLARPRGGDRQGRRAAAGSGDCADHHHHRSAERGLTCRET
jgi:hypothetical protein